MGKTAYRPLWVLYLSIGIRAAHQVGCSVILAAALLQDFQSTPLFTYLGLLSGVALLLTEAMRHRECYRELSGLVTIVKLLLLGAVFHHLLPPAPTLLAIFILASVGAHAPKNIRHRLLF